MHSSSPAQSQSWSVPVHSQLQSTHSSSPVAAQSIRRSWPFAARGLSLLIPSHCSCVALHCSFPSTAHGLLLLISFHQSSFIIHLFYSLLRFTHCYGSLAVQRIGTSVSFCYSPFRLRTVAAHFLPPLAPLRPSYLHCSLPFTTPFPSAAPLFSLLNHILILLF